MINGNIITNKGISIGRNSETLLNVLLGFNSPDTQNEEYYKLNLLAEKKCEINVITDLSLYNVPLKDKLWKRVIDETDFISGTVPVYLADAKNFSIDSQHLLEIIEQQSEEGVGIITIHPTASIELINMSKNRLIPFTSRGGGIVIRDLLLSKRIDNVYIQILHSIIKTAKENGTIISIGSSFRSASIIDAFDITYQEELKKQLEIADYLTKNGVQVIIETPGHADPRSLFAICGILKQKKFPIMPLGPIPTDIASNEDDTAAVIGATLMGTNNCADILSIITKDEHLGGIPSFESLLSAINKYEIAKHIIDLYKLGCKEKDYIASQKRSINKSCLIKKDKHCSRCEDVCPLRINIYTNDYNDF